MPAKGIFRRKTFVLIYSKMTSYFEIMFQCWFKKEMLCSTQNRFLPPF